MKNIPPIDKYFLHFTETDRSVGCFLLCEKFDYNYYINKSILILDSVNYNIKFGFEVDDTTTENYKRLIDKDSIFKLSKKDLK